MAGLFNNFITLAALSGLMTTLQEWYVAFTAFVPDWLLVLIIALVKLVLVVVFILLNVLFLIWWERKVSAAIQNRLGPMRTGWPHGWAQTLADTIKLLVKEDIVPTAVDKALFITAPVMVFAAALMVWVVIPFGPGASVADLNIGVLYIAAITSFTMLGIVMAGWASNNKWSLISAMRAAAQLISYEVPLVLAILGVVMLSGSMSMNSIVDAQSSLPFIVLQPLGFLVFLMAALAELNRAPFDLSEAESELVAGFNVEYSGLRWAFFFLAEYANLLATAAIITTLFLGGWRGPWLPPFVWFMIKTYGVITLIMWIRWTLPRVRIDQLTDIGWKFLLPVALLNIFLTGLGLIYLG